MADFRTFHGLRYNPDKVPLADVVAPPYDVIKGAMRDELIARNPYNIVQVELAARYGEDASAEQYERCATFLKQWRESGILVRDDAAFYIYEQEFVVPGSGETRKRRGTLGALTLEEFGEGVKPHEHTLSGPKEDRLKLLRATHTNTSPIFGLYEDNDGWVNSLLDNFCMGTPAICEARDNEGITHRLWRITDDETVNAIEAALEDEPIFIADGHHRYETALNYRNECSARAEQEGREWTGSEPQNQVMMMCVATSDEGLVVLPTHRLIKNVNAEAVSQLAQTLAAHFEIEPLAGGNASTQASALLARLNEKSATPQLGMYSDGKSYVLRLRDGDAHKGEMEAGRSDAYNALDVTILHRLILEKQLGIGSQELAAGGHVSYTIDAGEAMQKVDSGEYAAAFVLRSTPVEQVQEVAAAGDKMPQKSTYFYPKLITGMVLRPLD
jgi:uncharacterized protein (DUF1015 family)